MWVSVCEPLPDPLPDAAGPNGFPGELCYALCHPVRHTLCDPVCGSLYDPVCHGYALHDGLRQPVRDHGSAPHRPVRSPLG